MIHEDALRVSGVTKAPDYAFRIGGVRKFFLEAKKPSVNIKEDIHPAYQLRRYAWSAKLPLSILCDFEEFAVYDCRIKPDKSDPAATARVLYLRYTDYATRWDEIAGIFAKEAILKGSFDQYAESHKAKRGTTEVDTAFLEEIERWRELLARNLALRNPGLSPRELNFAVQQTIDRIIFLRICEDRGIEPYGELMGLQNGAQIYPRLVQKFLEADRRYNSGLFHFDDETEQTGAPDTLTPGSAPGRQGAQGHLQASLLPRQPLRVLRAAGRDPGPGLRALPGQGGAHHAGPPGEDRREAGGAQGGRRGLHARPSSPRPSWARCWGGCWRARRSRRRRTCGCWTWPAAPASF